MSHKKELQYHGAMGKQYERKAALLPRMLGKSASFEFEDQTAAPCHGLGFRVQCSGFRV